jgi:hypothetical protein
VRPQPRADRPIDARADPVGGEREPDKTAAEAGKFGDIAFTGFGIAVLLGVIGLVYVTFVKMVLSGDNPAAGIVLILFIIFAALALAYVFMNETLKEQGAKLNPELAKELEKKDRNGEIAGRRKFRACRQRHRKNDRPALHRKQDKEPGIDRESIPWSR